MKNILIFLYEKGFHKTQKAVAMKEKIHKFNYF